MKAELCYKDVCAKVAGAPKKVLMAIAIVCITVAVVSIVNNWSRERRLSPL